MVAEHVYSSPVLVTDTELANVSPSASVRVQVGSLSSVSVTVKVIDTTSASEASPVPVVADETVPSTCG